MKQLVFALIRRRIRPLYPEPLLLAVARKRGVQAGVITAIVYSVIFVLHSVRCYLFSSQNCQA